jgi:hypothetical protein
MEDAGMTDAYNSHVDEQSRPHQASDQHEAISQSEAQLIFTDLRGLRRRIIIAWQERGVILSSEEQRDLRNEIHRTCELLRDLVGEPASD